MKKIWRLSVKEEVPAGHALRNYNGKCEHIHGHNFLIELVVQGEVLEDNVELLLDFSILKQQLREAVAVFDHRVLNDIPPFTEINPTSENIAQFLWGVLEKRLAQYHNIALYQVCVSERGIQTACYMEIEE